MLLYPKDTIAAIATAPGKGGVGVIRISGQNLTDFAKNISGQSAPLPRVALYTDFLDQDKHPIDNGLLLYFPNPNSFTGEDVIELQGHGGPVVLHMLLKRCQELGARLAEPGEFSKRAFLNDKMDLAQAESVADLIDASSQSAARLALRSLKGAFSTQIHALVEQLISLRVLVEATLDFPEEDIDFLEAADAKGQLTTLQTELVQLLANAQQGSILREGIQVVLLGAPNVGKSSLLNALAGDDIAIVTDIAGTTRDVVKENITLDGVPLHIIDTAGLRQSDDTIEQIGMQRTEHAVNQADIVLILVDPEEGLNSYTQEVLNNLPTTLKKIEIHNKIDLRAQEPEYIERIDQPDLLKISAKTGQGLNLLKDILLKEVGWQGEAEGLFLARERHITALKEAQEELNWAEGCYQQIELFAEHLRRTQEALSRITGEFTADDLLGSIFSSFCIGK
ncbi:tRNA uridine-5-carboxymethylaminomethyl(34) synthesis GTPase MnmE [Neisseria sp. Ec49-e6-T10]|uniref:tRNA uridine-5-carboxymethylaminomethyl(34) synthesis GTPase MnmE n=1 Tax=Neisseria sp. Ec49-e6-T10 TaxID=3140744 RepID=UPI003EBF3976